MTALIHEKFGKAFPPAMVFGGYSIIAFGLLALLGSMGGLLIILLGSFIAFTSQGIIIDPEKKLFRNYASYFGIRQGKWESYEKYPFLAILKRNQKTTAYSRAMVEATTSLDTYYDIFLLSKTHRKKLLIKRLDKRVNAKHAAEDLAAQLGVEYTLFDPVISAKTRARRR